MNRTLNSRLPRLGFATILLMLLPILHADPARAQVPGAGQIAIRGATIWTMAGEPIENATILISGSKIRAIASEIRLPQNVEVIDARGKIVIPGLIDADSSLLLGPGAGDRAPTKITSKATDGIDDFAKDRFEEALKNGVTTVFVSPRGSKGVYGRGAVIKLKPNGSADDRILRTEAALCGSLGSSQMQPISRLRELEALRKLLEETKKYQEALEEYQEELEEYEKEIRTRSETPEEDENKENQTPKEEKKPDGDGPSPRRPKPDEGVHSSAHDFPYYLAHLVGDVRPHERGTDPGCPVCRPPSERTEKPESEDEEQWIEPDFLSSDQRAVVAALLEQKPEGEKKSEGEELKKPSKPKTDAGKLILIDALEGKIPVRLEVHRAEDILNVLDLNEEYPMDLILEGVTEGYKVAGALTDAKLPIVLTGTTRWSVPENNKYRDRNPETPAILARAGIPLAIASGADSPFLTRFIWMAAALAASHGMDKDAALRSITRDAATILRVEDRIGTLEPGKDADLVILSGSPFAGDSIVERVLIEGKTVYQRAP